MLTLAGFLTLSTEEASSVTPEKPCNLPVSSQQASHDYPVLLTCEQLLERLPEASTQQAPEVQEVKVEEKKVKKPVKALVIESEEEKKAKAEALAQEAERKRLRIVNPIAEDFYKTSEYRQAGEFWGEEGHDGLDFGVNLREDIPARSVATGVVSYAGNANLTPYNGCGNIIVVWHPEHGFSSAYCHVSTVNVVQGQVVQAGDPLGLVGTTGLSTGIHLHFMTAYGDDIFNKQNVFNPEEVLKNADPV